MRHKPKDGEPVAYVLIIEGPSQGPIVMETEGRNTGYTAVHDLIKRRPMMAIRYCIARLVYEDGNELLLADLISMQRDPDEPKPGEIPF